MSVPIVAVYSLKGGVGKTTLAVNLAWAAARAGRRTLLWDLDGQAAASWLLGHDEGGEKAEAAIRKEIDPARLVVPTAVDGLELLPADSSLRDLDVIFRDLDKKKRLAKMAEALSAKRDLVVIDCPPGLTDTSEQVLRAASLVVVPVIPAPLAKRALDAVAEHVSGRKAFEAPLLPVFSMVDRRRVAHREALAAEPDWPAIPMASMFEAMSHRRAPLGAFTSARSPGVQAVAQVWNRVERVLAK
ncbi:ParA family protein [Novosphingobium sp. JCM 18896]|uniref:ParA family protein n=1 Tax=Novosphingobium sp. JCM 18896 TaxID=2989731 RepID=UPI002223DBD3|nr:ParA family protein [Novosphingobium sp. JCM 18896]MCW1431785.1 ParA family protein [Novosphingobium sp. JCM 18896]